MQTTSGRTNWSGTVPFSAALSTPASTAAVRDAVLAHDRCVALGTAHSFSPLAVTPGEQVSTGLLPADLVIAPDRTTVTVGAGVRYGELGRLLHEHGLALAAMASLPHISVGGAIATGTHGSGDAIGTLSSAVRGLEVITADGETREVTPDDPDFAGWVVALGALGIVTRVTLSVEPTYDVAQSVLLGLDLDELVASFDDIFASATSVSVFTLWRQDRHDGQIWLKRRMDREGRWAGDAFGATASDSKVHPLETPDPVHATEQLGRSGPWFERLPHFRAEFTPSSGDEIQSEYLVPRTHVAAAIAHVRSLAARITPFLHVSEIRTMAADDLWLSPAYGRDTVGIHFTWRKDAPIYDVLPEIEAGLLPMGARPHWAKVTTATSEQLVAAYPRFEDFADLVSRTDPAGRFRTPFVERLLAAAPRGA